ncbi:hypothetical protein [Actinoplanes sp. RD1]|uniref:hypothetical protein n=1 Tax=Actinoplanes sp. RD1 TaxID=3064538 RepID=UPI0027419E5E|nr:hypothetical protein [Actinoplanes sp. RD1]
MASIDFGDGQRLELEETTDALSLALAAGGARLELRFRAALAVEAPARSYRIAATADVSRLSQQNRQMLCRLEGAYPVTPTLRGAEVRLVGYVSAEQLRVIDELRAASGDFWLNLTFDVSTVSGTPPELIARTGDSFLVVRSATWGEQTQRIAAASFIDVLVPMPQNAEMVGAVTRLNEARQLLLDGKYDPALGEARKALEPVRAAMRTVYQSGKAKTDAHQRLLDERFAMMVEDLFSLLSGAAHDDPVTQDFTYSREDAVTLIASTAGIVKRHIARLN